MKKTLVAVAAMAAVTGAMAQATISGFIDSGYTINKATTAANVSSTKTDLASSSSGQSQITFAASEDLGGGMKAMANIRVAPSPFTGAIAQDISEVGVSGGFGTALLLRDYGIDFMVHAAADASGWTSGATGVVHNTSSGTGNAVAYVLPTFVPGLGVVLAKGLANKAAGDGDATAYKLTYSTGGLAVQYAGFSVNNIAAGTASAAAGTPTDTAAAPLAAVAGTGWQTNFTTGGATAAKEATAANSKASGTALAITYDLGMAKLHYGKFSAKSGGDADQKSSSDMMGVSFPLGATTVGITSSSAKRTNAAGTTAKASGYRGKVSYALSKRTTAYAAYGSEKVDGTTQAAKQTAIGLTHSF